MAWFASLLNCLAGIFRSRSALQLENLALATSSQPSGEGLPDAQPILRHGRA